MDFLALFVLTEAVKAGSIAAAARRLRIAPMTATRSLAALEAELGVRLLHRTTRSLSLTDEGQTFLAHAQTLLEERDAALASIRPAETGATGLLRLTASSAFGRKIVAPTVIAFMRAHPEVQVDLLLTDSVVDLVPAGLDLAIRIAPLTDSSLVARRLAANPRGLFASPGYLAAAGTPATLAELQASECLAISGVSHWTFRAGDRLVLAKVQGRFTASSIEGIHQACLGGLGFALLSHWEVAEELAAGRLAEVRLDGAEPEPLAIWAVYPTRRMVPAKVRLFIQALAADLQERGLLPA